MTNLGLDMNGIHQVLAYAVHVNLTGGDIRTIERNANELLNACKDISLAVNTRKTKYMEVGRHLVLMANEHITVGSNSHDEAKAFKYFESLLMNRNSIPEKIKCRLKAGNSYYSVQTHFKIKKKYNNNIAS